MFYIYILKLTNLGYSLKPHLHNHYVLFFKNKFFVLSSNPVPNLPSRLIHTHNIVGQKKPQYLIENPHIYDYKHHIFEYSAKGMIYLAEHKEKFKPSLELLQQLVLLS